MSALALALQGLSDEQCVQEGMLLGEAVAAWARGRAEGLERRGTHALGGVCGPERVASGSKRPVEHAPGQNPREPKNQRVSVELVAGSGSKRPANAIDVTEPWQPRSRRFSVEREQLNAADADGVRAREQERTARQAGPAAQRQERAERRGGAISHGKEPKGKKELQEHPWQSTKGKEQELAGKEELPEHPWQSTKGKEQELAGREELVDVPHGQAPRLGWQSTKGKEELADVSHDKAPLRDGQDHQDKQELVDSRAQLEAGALFTTPCPSRRDLRTVLSPLRGSRAQADASRSAQGKENGASNKGPSAAAATPASKGKSPEDNPAPDGVELLALKSAGDKSSESGELVAALEEHSASDGAEQLAEIMPSLSLRPRLPRPSRPAPMLRCPFCGWGNGSRARNFAHFVSSVSMHVAKNPRCAAALQSVGRQVIAEHF